MSYLWMTYWYRNTAAKSARNCSPKTSPLIPVFLNKPDNEKTNSKPTGLALKYSTCGWLCLDYAVQAAAIFNATQKNRFIPRATMNQQSSSAIQLPESITGRFPWLKENLPVLSLFSLLPTSFSFLGCLLIPFAAAK